jgi:hypothetical protein
MKISVFVSAFVAITAAASLAHANLVVNGDFESGSFSGWTTTNIEAPWSGVRGFSTAYGCITPHGGRYYASLSNDYNAGTIPGHGQVAEISQTLNTTNGTNYTVSFWAYIETQANGSYPISPGLVFQAYWDDTQLLSIVNPPSGPSGWVNYQFSVIGTGSDTLSFYGANVPRYNGLDDVSVVDPPSPGVAAPVPGNLTLCGISGALGLGFQCARARRQRLSGSFAVS